MVFESSMTMTFTPFRPPSFVSSTKIPLPLELRGMLPKPLKNDGHSCKCRAVGGAVGPGATGKLTSLTRLIRHS
jgi:hypothetical protein